MKKKREKETKDEAKDEKNENHGVGDGSRNVSELRRKQQRSG